MESEEPAVPALETPANTSSASAAVPSEAATENPSPTVAPGETSTASVNEEATLRQAWAERIRAEARLPGGLRERLAAVVAESATAFSNSEEPRLTLSQVANVFAETLPSFLVAAPRVLEHPQGERFFHGDAITPDEASAIARQQLERTGF
jgi:hypothetical protein